MDKGERFKPGGGSEKQKKAKNKTKIKRKSEGSRDAVVLSRKMRKEWG